MNYRRFTRANAAERLPFGAPARIEDGRAFVERDLDRIDGIVRRTTLFRDAAEEGEPVELLTDGGLLAELQPGRIGWVELRRGKLVARG